MALPELKMNEVVRLRTRLTPGMANVRFDYRTSNPMDVSVGVLGRFVQTHGTEVLVELFPDPTNRTARGLDIWVPYHMVSVLFEAADAGGESAGDGELLRGRERNK